MVFEFMGCIGDVVKVVKLIFCVKIVPKPPAVAAVPMAASVMSSYCWSAHGKAMTGSETKEFLRMQKVSMASFGSGPSL